MQNEKLSSIQNILAVGTAAALIISCINLNFYWYTFGINIFDYLSISEILARSAFPIILTSGTFIGILAANTQTRSLEIGTEPRSYFSKFKEQIAISTLFAFLSAVGFYLGEYKAISTLAVALLILICTTQRFNEVIDYLTKTSGTPASLLLAIIFIVAISGTHSLGSAINVKKGTAFYYAEVKTNSRTIKGSYIGRSDSRVFLWSKEKEQVIIINQNEVKNISLTHERNLKIRGERTEPLS